MSSSSKRAKHSGIPNNWRNLSGERDWEGLILLDDVDTDLRRYLIHYGERVGAIYSAFISETKSKNCGLSRFPKDKFFEGAALEKGNPFKYEVTKFVYAAYDEETGATPVFVTSVAEDALVRDSNFLAYVAVTNDAGMAALGRRDILVVWRGSSLQADWIANFTFELVSGEDIIGTTHSPMLHKGWKTLYTATNSSPFNQTSARDQVFAEVSRLVTKYQSDEISITVAGHSMGAAMASLNAVDMAYNKLNTKPAQPNNPFPLTAFVFGCPRVGDKGFAKVFHDLHHGSKLRILRINELLDTIPHVPPEIFGYVDVGKLLLLNISTSPYIKPLLYLVMHDSRFMPVHNLELHLHDVAGTHGILGPFRLEVELDIKLVNKGGDYIKDEYKVITDWWTEKNKSMVQQEDGSWELEDGAGDYH